MTQKVIFFATDLDPPRWDLSGRRDYKVCLGVDRPPKTPLVDVEPKRGGDLR
jgi:hypothetical protein